MRRIPLAACAIALSMNALAQNEEDALRYSHIVPGGSARSWSMAGAFGAVGADPASATINPAGFGLYSTSELSITPGFEANTADATYYGTSASASQQRMSLNNGCLVLNYPKPQSNWRGGSFGLSFDRQASYYWKETAVGERVPSTILQRFVNEAAGTHYDDLQAFFPYTSYLAWNTYGMDTIPGNDSLYAPGIPFGSDTRQQNDIDATGRMNTTSFFYANTYKDKLYVGLAVGIIGLRYERYTTHTEESLDESVDLQRVRYKEDLITTGNGVDVKVGIIGRVGDRIRLGASFRSPMWLQLNDAYGYEMSTVFRAGDGHKEISPTGAFSYSVNTPWSVTASGMYQAGKHGMVSLDYTYVDYRQARLRSSKDLALEDQYDFASENARIQDSFVSTGTLRVGTEWRSGNWYFRGGWAYEPDAYDKDDARHGSAYKEYTGGIGYRATHWGVDLAGMYGTRTRNYYQYSPALVEPTKATYTDFRSLITFSLRP